MTHKKIIPRMSTGDFTLQNYNDSYSGIVGGLGCLGVLGSMLHAHAIGYCMEEDMEPSFRNNWGGLGKGLLVMLEDGWFHITEDMILDPERHVLDTVSFEGKDYSYSDTNLLKDVRDRIVDIATFLEHKEGKKREQEG